MVDAAWALMEDPWRKLHTDTLGLEEIKKAGVAQSSTDVNDLNTMRSCSRGKTDSEKDFGKSSYRDDSRDDVGSSGALFDFDARQRSNGRSSEDDQMIFDGGGEIPSSI